MPRPHYLLFGLVAYAIALRSMVHLVPFLADLGVERSVDSGPAAPVAAATALDLALLLGFASTHSLLARRSAKRLLQRLLPAGLETSFFSLVAGLQMTALLVFWRPLPTPIWSVTEPLARRALWALFVLGWVIVVIGFTTLRNARLFGLEQAWAAARGRPQETPSLRVVGIYRYLRHPLYAGTILSLWSTPEMSAGHLLFAAVFTAYILVGRRLEERDLERAHGESWRRYRSAVPAYLPRRPGSATAPPRSAPGSGTSGSPSER